jgi:hypothetical protein
MEEELELLASMGEQFSTSPESTAGGETKGESSSGDGGGETREIVVSVEPHTAGDESMSFARADIAFLAREGGDGFCVVDKVSLRNEKGLDEDQVRDITVKLSQRASELRDEQEPPLFALLTELRDILTAESEAPSQRCLVCLTAVGENPDSDDEDAAGEAGDIAIVKTEACFHLFHAACLAEWFFRMRADAKIAEKGDGDSSPDANLEGSLLSVERFAAEAADLAIPCPQCRSPLGEVDVRRMDDALRIHIDPANAELRERASEAAAASKAARRALKASAKAETAAAQLAREQERESDIRAAKQAERERARTVSVFARGIPARSLTAKTLRTAFCAGETGRDATEAQPVYAKGEEGYALLTFASAVSAEECMQQNGGAVAIGNEEVPVRFEMEATIAAEIDQCIAEAEERALRQWRRRHNQADRDAEADSDDEVSVTSVLVESISRTSTKATLSQAFGALPGFLRIKVLFFSWVGVCWLLCDFIVLLEMLTLAVF